MTFYVTDQNRVVLVLILLGALFGFLRDIIKIKRYFIKTGSILRNAEDIVYCIVFAFVYHITVFVTNYGYVRWYEFAGTVLGFMLYRMTLSVPVIGIMKKVLSLVFGLVRRILLVVLSPVLFVFKIVAGIVKKYLLRFGGVLYKRVVKILSEIAASKQLKAARKGFYPLGGKDIK